MFLCLPFSGPRYSPARELGQGWQSCAALPRSLLWPAFRTLCGTDELWPLALKASWLGRMEQAPLWMKATNERNPLLGDTPLRLSSGSGYPRAREFPHCVRPISEASLRNAHGGKMASFYLKHPSGTLEPRTPLAAFGMARWCRLQWGPPH